MVLDVDRQVVPLRIRRYPLGTAQETSTPSRSSRKSQWRLVAWCSWTTKRGSFFLGAFALSPAGSGVRSKSRFFLYCSSGI